MLKNERKLNAIIAIANVFTAIFCFKSAKKAKNKVVKALCVYYSFANALYAIINSLFALKADLVVKSYFNFFKTLWKRLNLLLKKTFRQSR